MLAWIVLVAAGLLEVVWSFAMKQSDGFSRLWPTVVTVAAAVLSVVLLSYSIRTLPLGTAYSAWTGIGAIGAFVVGVVVLHEPAGAARIGCAILVLAGIVGLNLTSGS